MPFRIERDDICSMLETNNVEKYVSLGGLSGIAERLHSDPENGLPDPEQDKLHQERVDTFGRNFIPPRPPKSLLSFMLAALEDFTLIMLIVSAIVSLVLGVLFEDPSTGWIEGAAILVSVVIVVLVGAGNDYAKELQFMKLNAQVEDCKVAVVRGGRRQEVSTRTIVVGDVIELAVGDILQADGILIEGHEIKTDESALTGETDYIKKNSEKPFLLSGTKLMEGSGKMLAVAVGKYSQAGIIKSLVTDTDTAQHEDAASVLQAKLDVLAQQIGYMGTAFAVACVSWLTGSFFYHWWYSGEPWHYDYFLTLLEYLITGITIIVVAVPEGLPLAVTLALAFSVQKMQKDNNLVKHIDACETMGSATAICSDKTGTLTTNKMTVMKSWFGDQVFNKRLVSGDLSNDLEHLLHESIALNSNARLEKSPSGWDQIGNKTECALLQMSMDMDKDYEQIRKDGKIVRILPFSSARKRMSTIIDVGGGKARVHCKGASEIVLGLCDRILLPNGQTEPLRQPRKDLIQQNVIDEFANDALRTICLAYKEIDESTAEFLEEDEAEAGMVCIGIVGIEDPVRDEVPAAIEQCRRAGITVRMVTGDNLTTARSIAKKCGLIKDGDDSILIEGPDFRERVLDPSDKTTIIQEEIDKIWPRLKVMARSSPTDKYLLVTGMMRSKVVGGEAPVVAVTGDGTNDAPALKSANVGFAMGIAGTSVAKDACDIILLDDNFNSIVKAVMWGRNVYDSIGKFLQFQLTVNVVALVVAFISSVLLEDSPLSAVQMLWVNLLMDSLASLSLATENPTPDLLNRPPYGRNQALISQTMWLNIIGHAFYQLVVVLTLTFFGDTLFGVPCGHGEDLSVHYTLIFNTFVMLQLFNEINARKLHGEWNVFSGLFTNMVFVGLWVASFLIQIVLVQYGGLPVSCVPLSLEQWGVCILLGAFSLVWNFVIRAVGSSAEKIMPSTNPVVSQEAAVEAWQHTMEKILHDKETMDKRRSLLIESQEKRRSFRVAIKPHVSDSWKQTLTAVMEVTSPNLTKRHPLATVSESAAGNEGSSSSVQTRSKRSAQKM